MTADAAVDLGRQALMITLLISSPVLLAGMLVGLVIGLLQALTQIQEQTIAFVPKLVAMIVALSLTLPWLVAQMLDYFRGLVDNIPGQI